MTALAWTAAALALCLAQDPAPVRRAPREPIPTGTTERELVVYDIADLTGAAELDALPTLAAAAGEVRAEALLDEIGRREDLHEAMLESARGLARGIELYGEPPFGRGAAELRAHEGRKLMALASAAQHAWIERFLTAQRTGPELVRVTVRLFSTPPGAVNELGVSAPSTMYATAAEFAALRTRLLEEADGQELTAPTLACKARQRGNVALTNQVAYVRDYELEIVQPGDTLIADPVIDVVHEGVLLDLWPVPLPAGYGLEVELTHSALKRPIPTREIRLSPELSPVTISDPEVTEVTVRATLVLSEGATVLLAAPDGEDERDIVVAVTLERFDLEAEEPHPGDDR